MKKPFLSIAALLLLVSLLSCAHTERRPARQDTRWTLSSLSYDPKTPLLPDAVSLRVGFFKESETSPFRGCVIYLEGLGDSVLNHEPLFKSVADLGYRVLFFDYMGQGGSEGSMNQTRVYDPLFPNLQISSIAQKVWTEVGAKTCEGQPKVVIGWSTGGLAAYEMAKRGWAERVVLIAPGIHPKLLVGEAHSSPSTLLLDKPVITLSTLTTADYAHEPNPHVEEVKPKSPLDVPLFASNLILTAKLANFWDIPKTVKGLVLLSGDDDTYVDAAASKSTLAKHASHFSVIQYAGAKHEIDNETAAIGNRMQADVAEFLVH